MSVLHFTKRFYGKLHLGMPLGINLRTVTDRIDIALTRFSSIFTTFSYQHHQLHYFYHSYNNAYNNERTIEIPIFRIYLENASPGHILEIGNVFSHYQPVTHTIVDKYEVAPQVINQDVVRYQPKKRFSLIISISTLEHVGQDESPCDPAKAIRAITHLRGLLKPKGICIVSVPVGHNHQLDAFIYDYALKNPTQVQYYQRINENNQWQEISPIKGIKIKYGKPFPCANGLAIATFLPISKT